MNSTVLVGSCCGRKMDVGGELDSLFHLEVRHGFFKGNTQVLIYSDGIGLSFTQGLFFGFGAAASMHDYPLFSHTQKSFVLTYTKQIILESESAQLNIKLSCIRLKKMALFMTLLYFEPDFDVVMQ